jgi:hypothetical protein
VSGDKLARVLLGETAARTGNPRPVDGPVEGRVTRVTLEGVYFTLDGLFGTKYEWGPASWSTANSTGPTEVNSGAADGHTHTIGHEHTAKAPVKGNIVLVVFALAVADPGQAVPWVLAWRA